MLGDTARTEAYRRAILGNAKVAFQGKQVMDLGAGSYSRQISTLFNVT
jgi:histone-arginine methyltransferase CARM1